MDVADHIARLRVEGALLADAAERAGLDTPVPTCPDWQVRDLVVHTGGVHRWAAAHVAAARPEPLGPDEEQAKFAAPGDDELMAWFRTGHADLVATLSAADPGVACWSFLPAPSPLAFWSRRQAHETAIHRADAQSAAATITGYPTGFAIDGIDELLFGFLSRRETCPVTDPARRLALRAVDADAAWTAHLEPDGRRFVRGAEPADLTVTGPAADLYLLVWNRRGLDGLSVDGDPRVLDGWRAGARVTWS